MTDAKTKMEEKKEYQRNRKTCKKKCTKAKEDALRFKALKHKEELHWNNNKNRLLIVVCFFFKFSFLIAE